MVGPFKPLISNKRLIIQQKSRESILSRLFYWKHFELVSTQAQAYYITTPMGQTLQSGTITAENQQIDVSNLTHGMYFISVGNTTRKFIIQ